MQKYAFLATTQMHNSSLLYRVSPTEYTRVLTLCDLKFCRYRSPCAWILLCSRPLAESGVVKGLVFRRYMDVAHPCISYHELCYVERLLLDFNVDYDVWSCYELSVWTKTCKLNALNLWCNLSMVVMYSLSQTDPGWGCPMYISWGMYQDDMLRDVSNLILPCGLSFWVLT